MPEFERHGGELYTAIMLWRIWAIALLATGSLHICAQNPQSAGWPEYGGNIAGQRYSTADEINVENVAKLQPAWTFHTHALDTPSPFNASAAFEATPVLWNGTLYFDSPYDQIFAVNAATGKLRWKFDPKIPLKDLYIVTSRGVALWHATHPRPGVCGRATVLVATLDRRLIARDAETGKACPRFGNHGTVDLSKGVEIDRPDLYFFTSPPIVVGDTIVLGSSVGDNQQLFVASGATRGFNATTGKQIWSWEPVRWTGHQQPKLSGSGNAWAPLAADLEHDLVFLPTGSASVDYYGGLRIGDNRDADSIVALRASTGEKVWAFQLVHHNIWDYDTASQPLLFNFRGNTPAVAITNKTGMIYVFNRLTGEPLYPIIERAVPKSDVEGEVTWPTQPFSTLPALQPLRYSAADLRGSEADRSFCREQIRRLNYQGLFTPPSEKGSLLFPSALGGPNWGSSALNPDTNVMYTRVNAMPYRLRLVAKNPPPPTFEQRLEHKWKKVAPVWLGGASAADLAPDALTSNVYRPPDMGLGPTDGSIMRGAPFSMLLQALVSPNGVPCGPAPFGQIVATNLNTRQTAMVRCAWRDGKRGSRLHRDGRSYCDRQQACCSRLRLTIRFCVLMMRKPAKSFGRAGYRPRRMLRR